ncbi:hypothetical protein C2G38_2234172 [Gigaspora rosea]|uniref:Zn(2)-C6 fungal-type domain-containing protein n=1 Tax=Gigaspora rosea TaxID=44941 RepID=A0A397TQM1_9GLOM|nr:hypothetical protein C2G38_2234172 [Gigaspora rosea]
MGKSRVKHACDHCRTVKLKCDDSNPCLRCLKNGKNCVRTTKTRQTIEGQNHFDIGLSTLNGDPNFTNIEDCRYWLSLQSDMSLQENPGYQDINVPLSFGEPYLIIDQQTAPQLLKYPKSMSTKERLIET